MKILKIGLIACLFGSMIPEPLDSQNTPRPRARAKRPPIPANLQRSATLRFLASEEGRSLMQVSGHPLSRYLNQAFGDPSPAALEAAQSRLPRITTASSEPGAAPAATVPCTGSSGARFNLEPRAGAVPQQSAAADFILNGAGSGADLIVQTANDYRGSFATSTWDNSTSGYYVHRSSTADCSVQFEGGLPSFTFQGNTLLGVGDASVVADPTRGAFFMADQRFAATSGIGLFRASAANLLNPTNCPNGTHLQAQAATCWMQTPPVLVNPVSQPFFSFQFNVAVDERATGTGAGDVYVAANGYVTSQSSDEVFVTACTNSTLQCSPLVLLNNNDIAFPYVQVRPDGAIAISYVGAASQLFFVTCTPVGAPNPPVCGQPVAVTTIANALPTNSQEELITPLNGIDNFVVFTYPKHATRRESNGSFTTFLVYDSCKDPYNSPPPPTPTPTICMDAEVNLTLSTDNGQTWSTPVSVDTASGHHFFPSVAVDQSTGMVNIVYYTTEGNSAHHYVRVFLNQIAPGSTAIGPAQQVTTAFAPMDIAPGFLNLDLDDFHLGAIARGTGTTGQSHLYTSFNRTLVNGIYNGKPLPDKNNHISLNTF
jgi:hypothetical protein